MLFGRTGANLPSRFLQEIPPDRLEQIRSAVTDRSGSYKADQRPERSVNKSGAAAGRAAGNRLKPEKPREAPAFRVGDQVEHKAFGRGVISTVTPMGGDALLEIAFEEKGTKRLMLRAASQFMTKTE
jgi:DNA helicase-2/ATP-dependent DNA helicase PcrA